MNLRMDFNKRTGVVCPTLFFVLLLGLPLFLAHLPSHPLALFDSFYRAGPLVFGGGHIVVPLLQAQVVPPGWISNDRLLAGYGAAPGRPLSASVDQWHP